MGDDSVFQPRRKLATYGKPARKRLDGFSHQVDSLDRADGSAPNANPGDVQIGFASQPTNPNGTSALGAFRNGNNGNRSAATVNMRSSFSVSPSPPPPRSVIKSSVKALGRSNKSRMTNQSSTSKSIFDVSSSDESSSLPHESPKRLNAAKSRARSQTPKRIKREQPSIEDRPDAKTTSNTPMDASRKRKKIETTRVDGGRDTSVNKASKNPSEKTEVDEHTERRKEIQRPRSVAPPLGGQRNPSRLSKLFPKPEPAKTGGNLSSSGTSSQQPLQQLTSSSMNDGVDLICITESPGDSEVDDAAKATHKDPCTPPSEKSDHDRIKSAMTTPHQMELWDALLEDRRSGANFDLDLQDMSIGGSPQPDGALLQSLHHEKEISPSPAKRRRRMIDALLEGQSSKGPGVFDELLPEETTLSVSADPVDAKQVSSWHGEESRGVSKTMNATVHDPTKVTAHGGPKVTYSRQRSYLSTDLLDSQSIFEHPIALSAAADQSFLHTGTSGVESASQKSLAMNPPVAAVAEEIATGPIRSIHELREAGGNKRFLDESEALFEDISDRRASMLSRRRSAILELCAKLADSSFARRFIDHGQEQRLLVELDTENDPIVGFGLASSMSLLLWEGTASHTVIVFRLPEALQLLSRLLGEDRDIIVVAKERRTNMSKASQAFIGTIRETIKSSGIWDQVQPEVISPRLLALTSLELSIRQARESGYTGSLLSSEFSNVLVEILASDCTHLSKDNISTAKLLQSELIISILESATIVTGQEGSSSPWADHSLALFADIYPMIDSFSKSTSPQIRPLALRLIINITNNQPPVCENFSKPGVIAALVTTVVDSFPSLMHLSADESNLSALDLVILALGALINLAEWSGSARSTVLKESFGGVSLLDGLLRPFLAGLETASQAESMEETHFNVAFGYLAVLLGNFAQDAAIVRSISNALPGRSLAPLIAAVDEFLQYHRKVDSDSQDWLEEDGPQRGFTERLQAVSDRLKQMVPHK